MSSFKWVFTDLIAVFVILNALFFIASITFSSEEPPVVTKKVTGAHQSPVSSASKSKQSDSFWFSGLLADDEETVPALSPRQASPLSHSGYSKKGSKDVNTPWWETIFVADEEEKISGLANSHLEKTLPEASAWSSLGDWASTILASQDEETLPVSSAKSAPSPASLDKPNKVESEKPTVDAKSSAKQSITDVQKRRLLETIDAIFSSDEGSLTDTVPSNAAKAPKASASVNSQNAVAKKVVRNEDAIHSLLQKFLAHEEDLFPENTSNESGSPSPLKELLSRFLAYENDINNGADKNSVQTESHEQPALQSFMSSILADPEAFSELLSHTNSKSSLDLDLSYLTSQLKSLASSFLAETSSPVEEVVTKKTPATKQSSHDTIGKKPVPDPAFEFLQFVSKFLAEGKSTDEKGHLSGSEANGLDDFFRPAKKLASSFLADDEHISHEPVKSPKTKNPAQNIVSSFLADSESVDNPSNESEDSVSQILGNLQPALKSFASSVLTDGEEETEQSPESITAPKWLDLSFFGGFFADPEVTEAFSKPEKDVVNEWVSTSSKRTWNLLKKVANTLPPFFA